MRGSLRETALGRLGRVDFVLQSHRFFREDLAQALTTRNTTTAAPVILLNGAATHADSRARANRVSIIGADERFWSMKGPRATFTAPVIAGQSVIINEPLAGELGAQVGDDVLIRLGKPTAISPETLLGRRDDTTSTLRLTVQRIIPAEDLGGFSLRPRQYQPYNAYIPLATMQRALDMRGRANAILVARDNTGDQSYDESLDRLRQTLRASATLEDLGLTLRIDEKRGYVSLESSSMLIEPAVEEAAMAAADHLPLMASPVLSYLANDIVKLPVDEDAGGIPYSIVAAGTWTSPGFRKDPPDSINPPTYYSPSSSLLPRRIKDPLVLNQWAAADLGAKVGDRVALTYYVTGDFGRLETRSAEFEVTAVVSISGWAGDPGLVPTYPGVTDVENMADWDPPFPVDFKRIRDKDEAYWDQYRTTPKGFVDLQVGERLWAKGNERFGRYTSIRLVPPEASATPGTATTAQAAPVFEKALLERLDLSRVGLAFQPVREQLRAASAGTTDFGGLFIGFSFFLIISAAMLVALLFRLGVERRSSEIGLLLAAGFSPRSVTWLLIAQGAVLAGVGSVIGIFVALGYAWFMLAGLRSWWAEAVNAPFLRLHASLLSFVIGFVGSFLVASISIAWSVRGMTRYSARSLLAGAVAAGRGFMVSRGGRGATITACVAFVAAAGCAILPALTDVIAEAPAFFISGAAMLVGCLALFTRQLQHQHSGIIHDPGGSAFVRLGLRNARRQRGRSILTAGLIASATFLISAIGAFHLDADIDVQDRQSPTGGFALFAESTTPLLHDPNTPEGRESLNIAPDASEALAETEITSFRFRPGDESGCLNLYRPTKPRIIGATDAMIQRGGFRFSSVMAESNDEKDNPWTLLNRSFDDGAIPVIGDEAAVKWQLHLALGQDLIIQDDHGDDVRLRFVALLSGSVLQDELIVAESRFKRSFPSVSGYGFFLIDTRADNASEVESVLERELAPFGLDVGSTSARLAEYHAVQNTYLSTFQTLGGFGLILGTVGLAAVLLRNAWERRGELALMRALGFSRAAIGWVVLAENVVVLLVGLAAGVLSAALAIAPHIAARPESIPWLSLGLTLIGVLAAGVCTGLMAVIPTLRTPLLSALRAE